MKLPPTLATVVGLLVCWTARGMYMRPESVPVERLLSVSAAVVKEHPKNAEAHYTLARIHYLAFVCATENLHAYPPRKDAPLPKVEPFTKFTWPNDGALDAESNRRALAELKLEESPPFSSALGKQFLKRSVAIGKELEKSGWHSPDLADVKAAEHIAQAIEQFHLAHQLDPKNSLYRLGYASLLEQAAAWAGRHPHAEAPELVRKITPAAIREEYRKAWEMELSADLNDKEQRGMLSPMDMVSYEAGNAFVRLAKTNEADLSTGEQTTLARIRTSLSQLEEVTTHGVTPIIFSTEAHRTLDKLLAP